MKIIAWYLPQFHEIPENNMWWGEGFTEWVNVKKAEKYHEKQYQPRIPLNHNYYNLLDVETMKWQVNLAKEYGIYGFCMHHYWFDGKLLLQKPVELYLEHKELDLPYALCWANEHWTNAWSDGTSKILIEQRYGGEKEWEEHFNYFLPFFYDDRYIKIDNKPLLVIYRPELIECIEEMLDFWNQLALRNNLSGITFACKGADDSGFINKTGYNKFDFNIDYQPGKVFTKYTADNHPVRLKIQKIVSKYLSRIFKVDFWRLSVKKLKIYSYDNIWEEIIKQKPIDDKAIAGAFVDWDCTPRKGYKGSFVQGATPEKFRHYFLQQVKNVEENYKNKIIFIFAWNEWAECGYLEPDERYGYKYLQAIHDVLDCEN